MKHFPLPQSLDFLSGPVARRPRKRLFIGLVTATSILLCCFLLVGWIIPFVGFGNIHPSVPYITGALLVLALGVIAWSGLALALQCGGGRRLWGADRVRGIAIKVFLPLMELLGRAVGFAPEEVRRSFIKVNNQLATAQGPASAPERVLILLPHCVQHESCGIRLSRRVDACKRCGVCPMAGLLDLRDAYGARLAVATGGSVARRIVVETRPERIIAIACERDLASGIQDTHPLVVFGILNHRPEGPCRNTRVLLPLVEDALRHFLPGARREPLLSGNPAASDDSSQARNGVFLPPIRTEAPPFSGEISTAPPPNDAVTPAATPPAEPDTADPGNVSGARRASTSAQRT